MSHCPKFKCQHSLVCFGISPAFAAGIGSRFTLLSKIVASTRRVTRVPPLEFVYCFNDFTSIHSGQMWYELLVSIDVLCFSHVNVLEISSQNTGWWLQLHILYVVGPRPVDGRGKS